MSPTPARDMGHATLATTPRTAYFEGNDPRSQIAMWFQKYIGIDYSGRGTPLTRTAGLQVYVAANDRLPKRVNPPSTPAGRNRNWCRKEVAEWLITQANSGNPFIAGLDFSFSLPLSYFQRYGLTDWDDFLKDFAEHWPTDADTVTVEGLRRGNPRTGTADEFRPTERWTSSAKSNFQLDVQGDVSNRPAGSRRER